MSVLLSPHFTADEMTYSDTAIRKGIDNTPPPEVFENLRLLAQTLERVRSILGCAVRVNSAYRCPKLNSVIGGSKNSAHMQGCAADIEAPAFGSSTEVFKELIKHKAELGYDQIIDEGRWVHIAIADETYPRGQELVAHFNNGGVTYETYRA